VFASIDLEEHLVAVVSAKTEVLTKVTNRLVNKILWSNGFINGSQLKSVEKLNVNRIKINDLISK
jgi:hypothetical protein